ncbi:MAG: hypothetical protein ACK40D_02195 [Cyanobacteriota bacterium]|jgi:hypothetical protein
MRCTPHWPPLELGRRYGLILKAACTGVKATIVIQAASTDEFHRARGIQERLGSDPSAWEQQIQSLHTSGNPPSNPSRALAAQPFFSRQAPSSPALVQLRQSLGLGHCSTPPRVVCLPGASP